MVVNDAVTREAITRKQERTFLDFIKNDTHYSKYYDGMYILFKTGIGFLCFDKDGKPMVAMHWEKYFQHAVDKYNSIYRV